MPIFYIYIYTYNDVIFRTKYLGEKRTYKYNGYCKKSEDLSTNIVKLTARRAIRYIYDELRHGIWKSALTVNSAFRPASFECRRWKLVTLENIVDTIIRPRYFTDHFYIECHITKKPYPTSREKIEEKKSFDIIVVTLRLHVPLIVFLI